MRVRCGRGFAIAAITAVVTLSASCRGGSVDKSAGGHPNEPLVITFAGPSGGIPDEVNTFVELVEQLSDGTITIDYVDNWRAGEPTQEIGLVDDLRAGKVDMAWVGVRAFDSLGLLDFRALVAPFLVDSYDLEEAVFAAGIPDRMLAAVDGLDLTGIGVLPGPMRKMTGVAHTFVRQADFEGATIGTSGGDLAIDTFRALGAEPVRIPAAASLDGLDAVDYHQGAVFGNQYYEQAAALTGNIDLWPRPVAVLMPRDTFADLTDDEQTILREAARQAVTPALTVVRDGEADQGRALCATGMSVVESRSGDRATLVRSIQPVYDAIQRDPATKAYVDEIRAIKSELAAAPDTLECAADASHPANVTASPLDGVWTATTSTDDAHDDPVPVPENYGNWVYVLDHGRFAYSQESGPACTWGYGTFQIDGDRVSVTFVDGGGISPNHALNKPGEYFVFNWSLYRDVLTLSPVPGAISPENFRLKPWHRTSSTPSTDVFFERCPPPPEAFPPPGTAAPPTT